MVTGTALVLAWALSLGPPPPASPAPTTSVAGSATRAEERLTLEEWLERLRKRRDERRATLAGELATMLAELDRVIEDPSSNAARALTQRIVELGDEVAPLLVEHIDPGEEPSAAATARAELLADALADLDATSVEPRLIELLETGSPTGRGHAADVLARGSGSQRAGAALLRAFEESEGALRKVFLTALLEVSGPARERVLAEVLDSDDAETIDQALRALAAARNTAYRPAVTTLLSDPDRSVAHASALLAFYVACGPEVVEAAEVGQLIGLARRASVPPRMRIAILKALPQLTEKLPYDLKRKVEPLREHSHPELREAALTALAFFGDRGARKELLAPYDERIDMNPDWALRWADRAEVYYAIGIWREAIQDWKKALEVAKNDPAAPRGVHVGLARARAQQGRLKEAADWLDKAPITTKELRALADDPVFQELREHEKYGRVFPAELAQALT